MIRYRATFRFGPPGSPGVGIIVHTAAGDLVARGIAWDRLLRMLGRNNKGESAISIVLDRIEEVQ